LNSCGRKEQLMQVNKITRVVLFMGLSTLLVQENTCLINVRSLDKGRVAGIRRELLIHSDAVPEWVFISTSIIWFCFLSKVARFYTVKSLITFSP
jgi:hypothetical protein